MTSSYRDAGISPEDEELAAQQLLVCVQAIHKIDDVFNRDCLVRALVAWFNVPVTMEAVAQLSEPATEET